MKDLWAVQSISSCRKYPKSLSGVRDLINFVGSMGRRANMPRAPPSIILNIIHSLHTDCNANCLWGRAIMHSYVPMGRSIRMAATTPSPSLSRTGKISYLCDFLGIRRNYEIIHQHICYFSKFFVDLFRDCWKLFETWKINSDSQTNSNQWKKQQLIAQRLVIKLQQPEWASEQATK